MSTGLIWAIRTAGFCHLVTLALATPTPIPPDWDRNLRSLPFVHRRFAQAQNFMIGAVIVTLGAFSLGLAPELAAGTPLARAVCGATGLFWGARIAILPWLRAHTCLNTTLLRAGFALLLAECAVFACAYLWLSLRTV